MKFDIVVE
jgi:hypothetical protein